MAKMTTINSLSTLEREISRLQAESKSKALLLDQHFDHLQHNFIYLLKNSFASNCEKSKTEDKNGSHFTSLRHEKLTGFMDKLADRLSDRAVESIDSLLGKLFHKRKK